MDCDVRPCSAERATAVCVANHSSPRVRLDAYAAWDKVESVRLLEPFQTLRHGVITAQYDLEPRPAHRDEAAMNGAQIFRTQGDLAGLMSGHSQVPKCEGSPPRGRGPVRGGPAWGTQAWRQNSHPRHPSHPRSFFHI